MANGTRSSRKAKDDEDNNSKGSQSSGKKIVNSCANTAEASGFRRSPRETLSKKNATASSSTRKSERLEKQSSNSNSMTPPAKRKSERIEKQKNPSPLRRSERGKMPSSSGSSGSKKSDRSMDSLDIKKRKEKKEKSVKQLTMETLGVNKIAEEDEQADVAQKKRMDARAYRALFRKHVKKVNTTDRSGDLKRTDSESEEDLLEENNERACERTVVTSTSQFAEEAVENNNEDKLLPTSQKDSYKDMSSITDFHKSGLVAREMNDDGEKALQEDQQNSKLADSMLHEKIIDFSINLEIVQEVTPPKRGEIVQEVTPSKRGAHNIDIDSVASPIMSSKDTCTSIAGVGALLTSGCKRKYCSETCGMCSKRQRIDCDSMKQEICSSDAKLSQLFESSDIKDRGKLDASDSLGHVKKPCNDMPKHMSSTDLQVSTNQNACLVCKRAGKLLCCEGKGCQRSYHLSCLEPPLEEVPLGVWHCPACVRKKIESGVHSVSEGIEAIWDVRELEASEDRLQGRKQYFVKYKGLAHVHNRWVPENQVLLEAPSVVAKYNRRNQGAVWKQQWAVPHRLLQKRLLMTPNECGQHHNKGQDGDKLNCHVEWLVKWHGLGYEHASWELENASFFSCPEGQSLIRDYETRRKKAKRASKLDKEREEAPFLKLSELPAGFSSRLNANIDAVSKLCNYWHKGQNAIILDDQERIPNVISFILSFSSDISRPFLIISTSSSLYSWDEEFLHFAPSADVVLYTGSKEIRKSIRTLEFYEEGGNVMFQVLITSPEVLNEDLNVLNCIIWEAIIVDECQRPRVASCFEQIKTLTARKRLLIVSSQLKDNVTEYLSLLSLLDSQSNLNHSDTLLMNSSDNIGTLKERLAKYIAYECKLESFRFVEYWVPVLLSNVQLEQYCFTLLSNSLSLCSPSRTDPVGAVRNVLISTRKCCDHPYVVDQSLQLLLTKGLKEVEFLDVGIKASGKLQLLDAMLSDIKKRELKVLILFQSIGGSGRYLMGDILDDYLRQRFGADSYERIDGGLIPSKKQSALNKFNNERERFVFLLETRACLSRIKLSAVGTVIIFGSDWSPMNDLRALQRITLDSQYEKIKLFRLYSSFTVEEKVLMLSKQDKMLDSNIQNVSPSNSHMLLKWGASYLFNQLDKFHGNPTLDAGNLSEQSHLEDVIKEFFIISDQTGIDNDASNLSLILQAKQNQGMYRTEMPLFGEQKIQVMNDDPPHIFWMKLLEGKNPQWKYSSCSAQRNRKRVQYFDDLRKKLEAESAEVVKRRKKVLNDCNDHISPKAGQHERKIATEDKEGRSESSAYGLSHSLSRSTASESDIVHLTSNSPPLANNISKIPPLDMVEWEGRRKQRDLQKNLHVLLRPQIAKLSEVLNLSEDVKAMVERFLEYVMNNHLVNREPATILQAFQISLCWSAASLLKHKIDHKESLALAKQHLGFTCKKEEADYVHSMLRCLKRLFLYRTGYLKVPNSPKASEVYSKVVGREYSNATSYQQNVKAKIEDLLGFREGSDIQVHAESGVASEFQLAQKDLLKSIKEIQKKCDKQMTKLLEKQREEMKQFNQRYEEEKGQLENKKRTEAAVIRLLGNVSMRNEKLKKLDIEYARKFDELKQRTDEHLKNLEALQVVARSNVLERKTRWVEAVKSWARVELVKPPVSESNLSEGGSCAGIIQSVSGSEVGFSKTVHIVPDEIMARSDPVERVTLSPKPQKENSVEEDCNITVCSIGAEEQAVHKALCPGEQVSLSEIPDGGVPVDAPVTVGSGDVTKSVIPMRCADEDQISNKSKLNMSVPNTDDPENIISAEAPSCEKIPDGATLSSPNGEVPLRAAENVNFCEDQESLASLQAHSSENLSDRDTLRKVNMEVPLRESVTAISSEGQENDLSLAASSVEVPDKFNFSKVDGQVPLREPVIADSGEDQENLLSSEEIPDGATFNMAGGVLTSNASEAVSSSEGQESFMSANSSPEQRIPDGATSNASDGDVPRTTPEMVTSCHGMEQIPDTATLFVPAEEVCLAESETAPREVVEGGSVHRENDGTSGIGIDQQDGIVCTTNRESEIEEESMAVLSPVQDVPTIDQGSPLPPGQEYVNLDSLPSQAIDVANSETRNASDVAETSFNAAIDMRCNESNADTTVVELREQMQPLRTGELTSNLSPPALPSVTATEHQPSNEGQTANQTSQAVRQPMANFNELPNQDILQPLQSPNDMTIGGPVRHASEARTASIPSVSSALPVQTAAAVSSRMPQPSYHDPLQQEMERIRKETDQTIKIHEDTKLQLKSECDKEIEEAVAKIRRRYEVKLQQKEAEFLRQKKELDDNYNKVLLNKILAEAFRSKCMDNNKASGLAGAQQEPGSSFMQQLVQLSSQQPSTASALPSTGSAISVQTVPPAAAAAGNAQTVGPPLQVVNPSVYLSGTPPRPPHIGSISRPTGNLQMSSEIRAPAPHLQAFRPSTSIPPINLPSHCRGIPNPQVHATRPVASPTLRQPYSNPLAHRPASPAGGGLAPLPNSSVPSLDVLMGMNNNLSGTFVHQESSVPSIRSKPAQLAGETDIVCLSDDD